MNERRLGAEKEKKVKEEGKRRKEKRGRSCLPNLNLLYRVLYVVDFVLYPAYPRE